MEEEWRDAVGYEGLYQVSNLGRVRSIVQGIGRRKRVLAPGKTKWGYFQVNLTDKNGLQHHESVHKLVAAAFVPIPENLIDKIGTRYAQVNHKDEDKTNNSADNLEWVSPSYNSSYGTITRRRLETHNKRKTVTSEAQVRQLTKDGVELRIWKSLAEIQRETSYNKSYICWCCKGRYKMAYGYRWEYNDWRKNK